MGGKKALSIPSSFSLSASTLCPWETQERGKGPTQSMALLMSKLSHPPPPGQRACKPPAPWGGPGGRGKEGGHIRPAWSSETRGSGGAGDARRRGISLQGARSLGVPAQPPQRSRAGTPERERAWAATALGRGQPAPPAPHVPGGLAAAGAAGLSPAGLPAGPAGHLPPASSAAAAGTCLEAAKKWGGGGKRYLNK